MSRLAKNLKKLRKDNNVTQEQLAHACGLGLRSVSHFESGEVTNPRYFTARKLAMFFHITTDELFEER